MPKIYYFMLIGLLSILPIDGDIERRAVLDIGSGGTKVAIADVDTESRQISEVLFEQSYPVPYQASLDKSYDGNFDAETKALGLKTFEEIKEIALTFNVAKITALATSAFRKANNAKAFIEEVRQQTDIAIRIIPQREEGEIAFHSAVSTNQFNAADILVWDIGTGSMQMTAINSNAEFSVYMGEHMGSTAFKSYITDVIQDKEDDDHSPNPISPEDLKMADSYARAFARKALPIIKDKINNQALVIGIGRLFYHSLRPIALQNSAITRKGLRTYINESLNKSDEELDNPFAQSDITNCILALAVMKALHIHEIVPIETTATRGILTAPAYWDQ